MTLGIAFKLSLYSLTGWILGAAEEGWIPYATLPMVVAGYLWSESSRSVNRSNLAGMNDRLASICGFIALAAVMNEYYGQKDDRRLLAVTHLLVYLTWILLLLRKTSRRYWFLLALGVLQLAVASVLTSGRTTIWFGLCAMVYSFAAIWTLSAFSLHRSMSQFALLTELNLASDSNPRVVARAPMSIWNRSRSFGSVQNVAGSTWLSMRFVTSVGFTAVAGLVMSALFFALIPRLWSVSTGRDGEEPPATRGVSRSGFTDDVRLGDMGPILESMDPVLQLRLFDNQTQLPLSPEGYAQRLGLSEPLFRGAVLSSYESHRWKADPQATQRPQPLNRPTRQPIARQDIRLEVTGTNVPFCIGEPLGLVNQNDRIRSSYQWVTGITYGSTEQSKRVLNYSVFTDLPATSAHPKGAVVVSAFVRQRLHSIGYLERNRQVPQGLNRLSALAQKIVTDERQRQPGKFGDLEAARAIETFLRDSGEFSYSVNLSIQDAGIDAVEDFLFNRKSGHCEYFASALVLMLRSVGIPARLVSGFKGGEYHADSNVLSIQQRHSHAWCEAWIDDREWLTLDATPADQRSASVESVSSGRSVWNEMRSKLTGIWSENVVNISLEKQEQIIYRPIREVFTSVGRVLQELWLSPDSSLNSILNLLVDPRDWRSARGVATLFVIAGTGWIVFRLVRRFSKRWSGWRRQRRETRTRQLVEFYERFVRLMQSRGLVRTETQTQREFAQQVSDALRFELQSENLQSGPVEISDSFYKVRFGDQTLPESNARHMDELLSNLKRILVSMSRK